jgi:hypothetical protein
MVCDASQAVSCVVLSVRDKDVMGVVKSELLVMCFDDAP